MASAFRSVAKAIGSVSSIYKDINPATLSGAIDIIVVNCVSEDGEVELACSPFHVRFGKLSVLRPIDRKVRVKVNGELTPFTMKVSETGEAFFVFETESDVPEDLLTSPLSIAVSDEDVTAPEPDFLDLASEKGTTSSSQELSSETASTAATTPPTSPRKEEGFGARDLDRTEPETPRPAKPSEKGVQAAKGGLLDAASKTVAAGSAVIAGAANIGKTKLTSSSRRSEDEPSNDRKPIEDEIGKLEEGMRADLEGKVLDDEEVEAARSRATTASEDVIDSSGRADLAGTEVRREARRSVRGSTEDLKVIPPRDPREESPDKQVLPEDPSLALVRPPSVEMAKSKGGLSELMLDMDGYKMNEGDVIRAKVTEENLIRVDMGVGMSEETTGDPQLVALTQALLRSADLQKSRTGSSHLRRLASESTVTAGTPTSQEVEVDTAPFMARSRSLSQGTIDASQSDSENVTNDRATSPTPSVADSTLVSSLTGSDSDKFCIRADEVTHTFELSLCGGDTFGEDPDANSRSFAEHQLTFEQLREKRDIVKDQKLVMRYNEKYLTWQTAPAILVSLGMYQQAIADLTEDDATQTAPVSIPERQSGTRSWKWWGRGSPNGAAYDAFVDGSSPPSSPPPGLDPDYRPSSGDDKPQERKPTAGDLGPRKNYAKTLRLTSDQLKSLNLQPGVNTVSFTVLSSYAGVARCTARIFLWNQDQQVVISDIDGTITKSDALGHVFAMIGRDWTHTGVAKLYTDIARNGYKLLYLTSRAVGQADTTREYLKGISQGGYQLPEGPVIMSPDRLMTSLHREVIIRKPEVFKMACLQDIQRLFKDRHPFYAGFGNRITDALSYRSVSVPTSRIFTIDHHGEVKMQFLELSGYKSSYIAMSDLVDQFFPPVHHTAAPEFTDFMFWRPSLPDIDLPDLSPSSPALTARSDGGSRIIRRFSSLSLGPSRKSPEPGQGDVSSPSSWTSMLTRSRASSPQPTSPLSLPAQIEDVDEDLEAGTLGGLNNGEEEWQPPGGESMPGSLESGNAFPQWAFERKRATQADEDAHAVDGDKERERKGGNPNDKEVDLDEEEVEKPDDDAMFPTDDDLDFSAFPYL